MHTSERGRSGVSGRIFRMFSRTSPTAPSFRSILRPVFLMIFLSREEAARRLDCRHCLASVPPVRLQRSEHLSRQSLLLDVKVEEGAAVTGCADCEEGAVQRRPTNENVTVGQNSWIELYDDRLGVVTDVPVRRGGRGTAGVAHGRADDSRQGHKMVV